NSHILFTSRNQFIGGNVMTLKCFTRQESIELLNSLLPNNSQNSLNELAENVNDYPLALVQASTYINLFPSLSVEEYIRLYKEQRKSLWKEEEQFVPKKKKGQKPLKSYQHTVSSTFTLLLEKVKENSSEALNLLK